MAISPIMEDYRKATNVSQLYWVKKNNLEHLLKFNTI